MASKKLPTGLSNLFLFAISSIKNVVGYPSGCCRYYPTCSAYVSESFRKLPLFIAAYYSIIRIMKCNPWSRGGYDPVHKKGTGQ